MDSELLPTPRLALAEIGADVVGRVRAALSGERGQYPSLGAVSERLFMSTRTLKRRLQERGLSFQRLLDQTRHDEALRLLQNPLLSVEAIAPQLGYSSSANFTRAFRKWTGSPPGAFRQGRVRAAPAGD